MAPVVAFIYSAGCGRSRSQEILLHFTEVRSWQCLPIFPLLSVSFSLFCFSPPTSYCRVLTVFSCVLIFFLCSILSMYSIRSLPQPFAHSRLVLPELLVYVSIFISVLLYFKSNVLCHNSFPDRGVLYD